MSDEWNEKFMNLYEILIQKQNILEKTNEFNEYYKAFENLNNLEMNQFSENPYNQMLFHNIKQLFNELINDFKNKNNELSNYNNGIDKIICLYDALGVNLIKLCKTGHIYYNQVSGNACSQNYAEGILIPFNEDTFPENELEKRLSQATINENSFDIKLADKVDSILADYPFAKSATVNRNKLNDCCEAWVYVIIETENISLPNDSMPIENFEKKFHGILTWNNSD